MAPVFVEGAQGSGVVLLLHGFGGSPADCAPLTEALIRAGRSVCAPVLPGHGGDSPRDLAGVGGLDWLNAARHHLGELETRWGVVDVVGFSLGGLLAMRLAAETSVRRLVLVNPYAGVPGRFFFVLPVSWWLRMLSSCVPFVRKLSPGQICSREGLACYEPSYMHLPLRTSLRLDVFMDDTWKSETLLTNETLLVVSNKDSVSSPDRVLARTQPLRAGPHTTTLRLEQSNHIALYDEDKELAIEAILTFFDSEPAPVDS